MKIVMNTDGGARGNPGPAGIGVVIFFGDEVVKQISEYIGETTNNQAEYWALIAGLEWLLGEEEILKRINDDYIECRLDSELVVRQLKGEYKMKNEGLKPLFDKICNIVDNIGKPIKFVHVYREANKEADKLVNLAIDQAGF